MEELEEEEVDPERQAMFQAQDSNPSPVLWVKVGGDGLSRERESVNILPASTRCAALHSLLVCMYGWFTFTFVYV